MAVDQVRVKAAAVKKQGKERRRWLYALFAVAGLLGGTLWYDWYSGRLGMIGPQPAIEFNGPVKVIRVPPGGNVQAALDRAEAGDIVELQAGAVYSGTINLPSKPLNDFVTVRSSAAADLPEGKRVTPAQRSSMATITAGMIGRPALSASKGANHYRFVGIEFTPGTGTYNYGLVTLGSGETDPEKLPHDIEIDRCYVHPHTTGSTRRGIALNSAATVIKNSYIEGFGFAGEETQGICGWTGSRNVQILNNYIEGGAENIMFGGADPASAELIPRDIVVRGNHLNKPAEWNGKATVKTIFELKNARRVEFAGNVLTNNWKGSAFRITVRDQDGGAPFSTIEDVVIRDNLIDGAGEGINILGRDDTYESQTLKRLTIRNNLFLNLAGTNGFEGSGYFIQVTDGEEITIENNTVLNRGNIITFYGALPRSFTFSRNITGHGSYGVHGPIDLRSDAARRMISGNVFMNLNRVDSGDFAFPQGNTLVNGLAEVGFADAAGGDYTLAAGSKLAGAGVGASISAGRLASVRSK
jgi:hypothetical protein